MSNDDVYESARATDRRRRRQNLVLWALTLGVLVLVVAAAFVTR